MHYAAGGLFRWVEHECNTWEKFKKAKPKKAAEIWAQRTTTRVPFALSLFSKVDELVSDHASVFG